MARVVTINRPDHVELIEQAAEKFTSGNRTEAVALGIRRLLDEGARNGSLFGTHRGSVKIRKAIDLSKPLLDDLLDAESGDEIRR